MKALITGATGLIGRNIIDKLKTRGDEIVVISRSAQKAKSKLPMVNEYIEWNYDNSVDISSRIKNVDAVIHLAGENVMARRWNEEHKKRVLDSRIKSTDALVNQIAKMDKKPEVFICASASGYYGSSETETFVEDSNPGNDFLAEVSKQWENSAAEVEKFGVRRVSIRTGIVLSKEDGALAKMLTPFKLFVGGPLGSGRQWFPWIHIDDLVNLFIFPLENKNLTGPVNGVAPGIVKMKDFAKTLGKVINRPALFPVPGFILKLVLGEGAKAVLEGADIKPKRTQEAGFRFSHPELKNALEDLLRKN
ncbi:MAG: TIGR01777 family oxidoreductase [Melioribacteraceae bacterium]|nr:TIGR01777 family oxidoreductase [Melioribacteraceae bacterium]MCF8353876.1 TIGR01777 family oxidoreductase [Melioribacteraceae bacterium]MCF8393109.1 TIGR01777 family oxidoreductase [Melioribacteraceae bacterium]MCF8419228.1 TIGR01777 family oxidoreductase [Melioribacteraceae bacterium]